MKKLLTVLLLTAAPLSIAFAGPFRGYCGGQFYPGGGIAMWILTIVIAGLMIYLIYRSVSGQNLYIRGTSPDAVSILKARLAKGEISEEEYDKVMSKISN